MSSLEDRVVIVPHELTSMIHGLVLTTHLEDKGILLEDDADYQR
jgi:hypothetical protein